MTSPDYLNPGPSVAEVKASQGFLVLEFGTSWCPHCQAAQPLIALAMANLVVPLVKVEDGKGRALGRAFHVKLWPTLVFLHDGLEQGRVVRPPNVQEIGRALARLTGDDGGRSRLVSGC